MQNDRHLWLYSININPNEVPIVINYCSAIHDRGEIITVK